MNQDTHTTLIEKEIAYIPSTFILTMLPRTKKEASQKVYEKEKEYKTDKGVLRYKTKILCENSIPYGKYARLLLALFTTAAITSSKRQENVELMFKTNTELAETMLIAKPRIAKLMEQAKLMEGMQFKFETQGVAGKNSGRTTEYITLLKKVIEIKLEEGNKKNKQIRYIISKDFVDFSKTHSVPLDYNVLCRINDALTLDVYTWLVYRNNSHSDKEYKYYSIQYLIEQFDLTHLVNQEDAKDTILNACRNIKTNFYKELDMKIDARKGIELRKSESPVCKYLATESGQKLFSYFSNNIAKIQDKKEPFKETFDTLEYIAEANEEQIRQDLVILQTRYFPKLEIDEEKKEVLVYKVKEAHEHIIYVPIIRKGGECAD